MKNKFEEFLNIIHQEHKNITTIYMSSLFRLQLRDYINGENGYDCITLESIMDIPIFEGTLFDQEYEIIYKERI